MHVERGPDENLNAPGARFVPLPFEEGCQQPVVGAEPDATPNRLYLYGVVSRLALLAASRELKATHPASQVPSPSLSVVTPSLSSGLNKPPYAALVSRRPLSKP